MDEPRNTNRIRTAFIMDTTINLTKNGILTTPEIRSSRAIERNSILSATANNVDNERNNHNDTPRAQLVTKLLQEATLYEKRKCQRN